MKMKLCEIINAITILKTQNNDVNSRNINLKMESPTLNVHMKRLVFIYITLMYLVGAHTNCIDLCPSRMIY